MKRLIVTACVGLLLAACTDKPNTESGGTTAADGAGGSMMGSGGALGGGGGAPGGGEAVGGGGAGASVGNGGAGGGGDLKPSTIGLVAPAPQSGTISAGHCAIDPKGNIYVTWQQGQGNKQDIWLTQSTDGGKTFQSPIAVENGPATPIGGWDGSRKPYVATAGTRVVVAYGTTPNGYSGVRISTTLAPLTLGSLIKIGSPATSDVEEFQKPVFSPQGNIWVTWHWTTPGGEAKMVSREEANWAYESASGNGTPGEPCDCCPHDIRVNAAGDTLVAYRNNVNNIRDHWVSRDPGSNSGFGAALQASTTNWEIFACPVNGPRLSETPGGTQLMTWADPTSGSWRVWLAESKDGGVSWSGDDLIVDAGTDQKLPSIATSAGGRIHVVYDQGDLNGQLTASDDDGATFAAPILVMTNDGKLGRMELCRGPTRTGMVGVTAAGSLWWAGY